MNRLLTAALLAAPQPGDYDPSTGKGPEWGKAAPIGLLVILLLAVALFFLLRSFTRQLKKVPATFDTDTDTDIQADTGTGSTVGPEDDPRAGTGAGTVAAASRADGDTAPRRDGPPNGHPDPDG